MRSGWVGFGLVHMLGASMAAAAVLTAAAVGVGKATGAVAKGPAASAVMMRAAVALQPDAAALVASSLSGVESGC